MANVKITELTALTDPASTDVLPIVDVAADVTKKISIADLLENAGSGTAAAPGIAFDGDSNTGIYRPGADQLAISTNGTQRINIEADGDINIDSGGVFYDATNNRLAIGTTSPSELLHVSGTSNPSFQLTSTNDTTPQIKWSTNGVDRLLIDSSSVVGARVMLRSNQQLSFGTNNTERMRIDSSGRVGISISDPLTRLDLGAEQSDSTPSRTASKYQLAMQTGDTASAISHNIGFYLTGDDNVVAAIDTVEDGGNGSTGLVFATSSNTSSDPRERMRIDSAGRLLIGTSSTTKTLTQIVQGNSADSTGNAVLALAIGRTNPNTGLLGQLQFTNSSHNIGARIHAEGANAWTDGTSHPANLVFSTTADGASSPTERMRITNSGATYSLIDNSEGRAFGTLSAASASNYFIQGVHSKSSIQAGGTRSFGVFTNGNVVNTNNSYGAISDIKLKENIVDAGSQWDDLKAIQIRNWNFKAETGHATHRQIGPIAQELEQVCPGLVFETPDRDSDGNDLDTVTKGVNQSVLYMKAVKALQEAMERIETLEASNADLLTRVSALESA